MINKFRKLLIQIGKVLPFVVCFLVCEHYIETLFTLPTNDFLVYDSIVIPNITFSRIVAQYFEYNLQTLAVLVIISIAIETCIYNKLACGYLGVNLAEKSYFDFELEPTTIYIICLANIIVAGYLTLKGIKILLNSRKQ